MGKVLNFEKPDKLPYVENSGKLQELRAANSFSARMARIKVAIAKINKLMGEHTGGQSN